MHARVLKFHVWIPHEKIAFTYFFPRQDYAPFLLWPFEEIWMVSCQQNIEARALKFKE